MDGRQIVDANEQQLVDAIDRELETKQLLLDGANDTIAVLRSDLTATEAQLSSVSDQLSTTKSQLDAANVTIEQQAARIAELEAQLPPDPEQALITGQNQTLSTISAYLPNETPAQQRQRVIDTYGRFPMSKLFYGGLPQTWDASKEGAQPERRVVICYTNDDNLQSHAESVPSGWWVIYVPWQEADLKIQDGVITQSQLNGFFTRGYPIVNAAQKADNRLEIWPCLAGGSGYKSDPAARATSLSKYIGYLTPLVGKMHGVGIDCYINPFGIGGTGYDSQYKPDAAARLGFCFDVLKGANVERFGVMEFGAPARTWDSDRSERANVLNAFVAMCQTGYDLDDGTHVRAEFALLFNQQGTQWDQRIVAPPLGAAEPWVADWRALNLASG